MLGTGRGGGGGEGGRGEGGYTDEQVRIPDFEILQQSNRDVGEDGIKL